MTTFAQVLLNTASLASLLFLVAAGLSLTFGLMRVLNMTHGSFYLLGAYVGLTVWRATGNTLLALLASSVVAAVAGGVMYWGFLKRFSVTNEMPQALLTFGALLLIADFTMLNWGADFFRLPGPAFLRGAFELPGGIGYPKYRFFLMGVGLALALSLWLFVAKTKIGALVRAGVDDKDMVQALGINTPRVFLAVFMLGSFLAGFAGIMGAPFLGINPGLDFEVLILAFVVVIVGGVGSIEGAFVGAIVVALIDTTTKTYVPELAWFSIYVPMAVILALRPKGLLGRGA